MEASTASALKRALDVVAAVAGLVLLAPLLAICAGLVTISTRDRPLFTQERVGRHGATCRVRKFRTMRSSAGSTVTVGGDPRITRLGSLLRRVKLDELPQLLNVVQGSMSLVGPRPDVAGFADALEGDDRIILMVRPGVTGPASVVFRDEEEILRRYSDPELFNREVLFPAKVRINRTYVEDWSFSCDLLLILRTVLPLGWQPKLQCERAAVLSELEDHYRIVSSSAPRTQM